MIGTPEQLKVDREGSLGVRRFSFVTILPVKLVIGCVFGR